jgi:hypothetical protein
MVRDPERLHQQGTLSDAEYQKMVENCCAVLAAHAKVLKLYM